MTEYEKVVSNYMEKRIFEMEYELMKLGVNPKDIIDQNKADELDRKAREENPWWAPKFPSVGYKKETLANELAKIHFAIL